MELSCLGRKECLVGYRRGNNEEHVGIVLFTNDYRSVQNHGQVYVMYMVIARRAAFAPLDSSALCVCICIRHMRQYGSFPPSHANYVP